MNIPYIGFLLLIAFGFIYISYKMYKYVKNKKDPDFIPNNEFRKKTNKNSDDVLLFFYADWCSYSKESKKVWDSILKDVNFEKFGISYVSINSNTKDNFPIINEYNIKEYPSLVLKKNDKKIIFDTKLTKQKLLKFLTTVYGS